MRLIVNITALVAVVLIAVSLGSIVTAPRDLKSSSSLLDSIRSIVDQPTDGDLHDGAVASMALLALGFLSLTQILANGRLRRNNRELSAEINEIYEAVASTIDKSDELGKATERAGEYSVTRRVNQLWKITIGREQAVRQHERDHSDMSELKKLLKEIEAKQIDQLERMKRLQVADGLAGTLDSLGVNSKELEEQLDEIDNSGENLADKFRRVQAAGRECERRITAIENIVGPVEEMREIFDDLLARSNALADEKTGIDKCLKAVDEIVEKLEEQLDEMEADGKGKSLDGRITDYRKSLEDLLARLKVAEEARDGLHCLAEHVARLTTAPGKDATPETPAET